MYESVSTEVTPGVGRAGDAEKLLREHRENQDLVRSIGPSHYQIIFPVQLRHHEKMGISTREIGATKVKKKKKKPLAPRNPPTLSLIASLS